MSQTISGILEQTKVINQTDTYNFTAPTAGMYFVSISVTEQPPSGLSILLQQNGSTKASFSSPAAAQGVINLQVVMNCAASDTISAVLSSSTASDLQKNAIRAIFNVHQGST